MPVFRCRRCSQEFPSLSDVRKHGIAAHGDRSPSQNLRRGTAGPAVKPKAPPAPTHHRIEDIGPAEPPAPRAGPSVGPSEGRRPVVEQASTPAGPTRQSIGAALTDQDLADILVMLSRALSEADGAGEAGVLLRSEAVLVAKLIHESTVDLIVKRFDGNVEKAKLGLAVLVVVIGRGRVHLRAVSKGISASRQAKAIGATASAWSRAGRGEPEPTEDESEDDNEAVALFDGSGNGHVPLSESIIARLPRAEPPPV